MSADSTTRCPSSQCRDGAILLGVVRPDGRISFINEPLVVDREFVEVANAGRSPEKRFRFSSFCIQGACTQWTGSRCGVIDKVREDLSKASLPTELPNCSIRPECRWYLQSGEAACAVCLEVVTDLTK